MLTLVVVCAAFLCVAALDPQSYMVPMRDGVELNTVVILNTTSPLPVVLIRTPYGTASAASTQEYYVSLGYNTVSQDFRGRYDSQGTFDFWNHSSPDAYDTMAWITSQNWSTQDVYTQGVSANGIACYLQAEASPPWLKSQLVVFGTGDLYKTVFQGGAYRYSLIHGWLNMIEEGSYETLVLQHEEYSDFWGTINDNNYWTDIKWPAVHQTGWYDIFLQQQLDAYAAYRTLSQQPYADYNFLVIGPGGHCSQGGQVPWPESDYDNIIATYLANLLFAYTRGDKAKIETTNPMFNFGDSPSLIYYYVMGPVLASGEIGNYWTNATTSDSKNVNLYLNNEYTLTLTPSTANGTNATFIYNPTNPVPTYGGNNLLIQCGPMNQIDLESSVRSDVLSFTTAPFDQTFTITGRVTAVLYVSSNCTDTDFTVKFTDVYPTQPNQSPISMLIQDGIVRMRWRENNTVPVAMVPGEVYQIEVDLWSTSYIFNVGHQLRVDISSSNYPRFSANLNNFQPLINPGEPLIAANTIYFDSTYQSYLQIPVVPIPAPITF